MLIAACQFSSMRAHLLWELFAVYPPLTFCSLPYFFQLSSSVSVVTLSILFCVPFFFFFLDSFKIGIYQPSVNLVFTVVTLFRFTIFPNNKKTTSLTTHHICFCKGDMVISFISVQNKKLQLYKSSEFTSVSLLSYNSTFIEFQPYISQLTVYFKQLSTKRYNMSNKLRLASCYIKINHTEGGITTNGLTN